MTYKTITDTPATRLLEANEILSNFLTSYGVNFERFGVDDRVSAAKDIVSSFIDVSTALSDLNEAGPKILSSNPNLVINRILDIERFNEASEGTLPLSLQAMTAMAHRRLHNLVIPQ